MTTITHDVAPAEICKNILHARERYASGEALFKGKDFHRMVYNDGVWVADLTVNAESGEATWKITKNDENGKSQISPFTMRRAANGEIEYDADFEIKQEIVDKLLETYECLEKAAG